MKTIPIINQKIFDQNLLLTQAYCDLQLANSDKSPAEILRSFNPELNGQKVFNFKPGQYDGKPMNYFEVVWSVDPWMDGTKLIYHDLFDQQLANKRLIITFANPQAHVRGQVLIAEVDWTTVDGCSEANSDGIIDIFDCPAIDTWFYLTENTNSRLLFCWIPEQFIALINVAVAVNATDCLRWFDESLN